MDLEALKLSKFACSSASGEAREEFLESDGRVAIAELPAWQSREWLDYTPERTAYRRAVLRPALETLAARLSPSEHMQWTDLGCGDAEESVCFAQILRRYGAEDIRLLAVDRDLRLLERARARCSGSLNASFVCADLSSAPGDVEASHSLFSSQADLVTAFYTLHDIECSERLFREAAKTLSETGIFIVAVVHPDWVEHLERIGDVEILASDPSASSSRIGRARWRGQFKLRSVVGRSFWVPYFHRSLSDYLDLFSAGGFDQVCVTPLPESLESQVGSSFAFWSRQESTKWLWPGIDRYPTSLLLSARRSRV